MSGILTNGIGTGIVIDGKAFIYVVLMMGTDMKTTMT